MSSAAALAAATVAASPPPVVLRIGESADVDVSSVIWQIPNGIFERLGLSLQLQRLNNGSAVSAAVIGGSIEIGASSIFSLLNAHLRGVPFVLQAVQAIYDANQPGTAFVVAKDSPIASAAQLNGKTISTAALGDLFQIATSAWIDANGGDAKTVSFVELPIPAVAAAIASGRTAGALLVEPFLEEGIEKNQVRVLGYPYNMIAQRFGVTYYFTTRDYALANADLLARWRRGLAQSAAYAQAHKAEIYQFAAKLSGTSLATVQHTPFDAAAGISVPTVQAVIDYAAKYKFIKQGFPAADIIDPNALKP